MLRRLIYPLFYTLLGSGPVLILYCISSQESLRPAGFYRSFPPHTSMPADIIDLKSDIYNIIGSESSMLYLNRPSDNLILQLDCLRKFSKTFKMLSFSNQQITRSARLHFANGSFSLLDGVIPSIVSFSSSGQTERILSKVPYFVTGIPYADFEYLLRIVDTKNNSFIIKVDSTIRLKYELKKQVDGFFCTDGDIVVDPSSKNIVYIYRYRNEFISLDSTLNSIFHGKTIDTVSTAKIRVSADKNENLRRIISPPVVVNKGACIDNKLLYVHSALKAENENKATFDECSVIDVYSLQNGKYKLSFYIPDFRSFKIKEFYVSNNVIYAIQGKFLCLYKLQIMQ